MTVLNVGFTRERLQSNLYKCVQQTKGKSKEVKEVMMTMSDQMENINKHKLLKRSRFQDGCKVGGSYIHPFLAQNKIYR